jgi:hypothetical protein
MANGINRIQTLALGFLSHLGIKSQGRNPVELEDNVRAIVDMEPYYYATRTQVETTGGAAGTGAIGDADVQTVPQGEVWVLFGVGMQIIAGGAIGPIRHSFFVRMNTAQNSFPLGMTPPVTLAGAGERFDWGFLLPKPIVLPAGSTITQLIEIDETGGGGVSPVSRNLIARIT